MHPPRLRPIHAAVLGLVATLARAQDEALWCYPSRPAADSPAAGKARIVPPRDALRLWADVMDGHKDRDVVARGRVNACRSGVTIVTEELQYSMVDDTCTVPGAIRMDRYGDVLTGNGLRYRFASSTGELDDATYALAHTRERRYAPRGEAKVVEFKGPALEHLTGATYTTCEIGNSDWIMNVRDLDLDRTTQIGVAHNATVRFMDVPILYTPYISFPLNDQRKSGFLAPVFGTTGQSGFEIATPWYWNIAPNLDDTLTPRLMSRRGLQLTNEFRYLEPKFSGEVDAEVLPEDRVAGQGRSFYAWRHTQNLGGGFTATANLQHASDVNYFRDLSTRLNLAVQTQLPRDLTLSYANPNWTVVAHELHYQTLYDPANPTTITHPYALAPQISATGNWFNRGGADLNFTSELTRFEHPTLINGSRLILYPSVSYPLQSSAAFFTPKIGYHVTDYKLGDNNTTGVDTIQRRVPIYSVDSGLILDRELHLAGNQYQQTLEPRLYYVRIPFRDQSAIPNFSTGQLDFSFAQLFTENQFIGGDRINDADQLTTAVTSRLIDDASGSEVIRGALGQRYYFRPQTVTLDPSLPLHANRSDILVGLTGQIAKNWALDSLYQYSPSTKRTEQENIALRWRPEPGKALNLGYSVRRDSPDPTQNIEAIDLSAQWPLTPNWYTLLRYNYSLADRRMLEGLAGFEYNKGCWTVRLVAHRFVTAEQQVTTAFFVQLELNGLSKIGINPLETLRQSIPGYTKSNEVRQ